MERVFERVCQEDDCVQSVEALLPIYEEAMLLELNFFAEQPGL